ncbi:MAG: amino acid permease [Anaerolineales bacterium]|nr:amino acid permease [Anaerolineales bacterium]
MLFAIALLIVVFYLVQKAAPHERPEDAHIHGPGQIGVIAALALFGVDYFTSFYYASGELLSALHPYGLQDWGYTAVAIIAACNIIFGALYMYSLGVFNEGGGSYTAAMRYLSPGISLIVAVVLLQDYIFTIVVSTLSGVDQLLSVLNMYDIHWVWHFLLGVSLSTITWYLTIRGRGESSRIVFTLLGVMIIMSIVMAIGLIMAAKKGVPPAEAEIVTKTASFGQALYHLLTASMKGLVALSGLEAMSNGIQFVKDEDFALVRWGKKRLPKFKKFWDFYSGKSGIGRLVQTSFLFYGGMTTFFLVSFAIRFNVFDGTFGRTLVGNLAYIGFGQFPGGILLFWVYQILAVALLTAASMTAFQDLQATGWRDVAIGEIPEFIVYRNPQGTFTRSVTAALVIVIIIEFLIRGKTSLGVPYYGIGVYMPIMMMGLAVRQHILKSFEGKKRKWGGLAAGFTAVLAAIVFVGQIVGKWEEGGWIVLISFSLLIFIANLLLVSPGGYRSPEQIHRIVRTKAQVNGAMGSIVEWQSLKMQEYRYHVLMLITHFFEIFGIRRPTYVEAPPPAGEYDEAIHIDHPEAPSILACYIKPQPHPAHSQD